MEYLEQFFRSKKSSVSEEYYKDLFSVDDHFHELTKDSAASSHEFYLFLEEEKAIDPNSLKNRYYISHKIPSPPAKNSLVFQFLRTNKEMKYYYEARANIMHRFSNRDILLFLDGQISEPIPFFNKMEAMCFCYFIMIQREKYNLLMDVEFFQNLSDDDIYKLLLYYDFLETLKWSIYDPAELKKIKDLVYSLTKEKNVMKDYFEIHPNTFIHEFDPNLSYFQKKENITELSNIVSVQLFRSSKYNKTIYLFGEKHVGNAPCHPENFKNKYVVDFIRDILYSPSFFKDFIFENWYANSQNENPLLIKNSVSQRRSEPMPSRYDPTTQSGSNLDFFEEDECLEQDERNQFHKKIHKDKKQCAVYRIEQGDLRFHLLPSLQTNYSRFIIFCHKHLFPLFPTSVDLSDSPYEKFFSQEWFMKEEIFEFLKLPDTKKYISMFFSLFYPKNIDKVSKMIFLQIKKSLMAYIKKSYLFEEIIAFFRYNIKSGVEILSKKLNATETHYYISTDLLEKYCEKSYQKYSLNRIQFYKEAIHDILSQYDRWMDEQNPIVAQLFTFYFVGNMIEIHTPIMDAFIHTKLFKKMKHQPSYIHGPDEYRNVLFLAGNAHIKNTSRFLLSLGFEKIQEENTRETRPVLVNGILFSESCTSIQSFNRPFFTLPPIFNPNNKNASLSHTPIQKVRYQHIENVYVLEDSDLCYPEENRGWNAEMELHPADAVNEIPYLKNVIKQNVSFKIFKGCKWTNCGIRHDEYIDCENCSYIMKISDVKGDAIALFQKLQYIYKICSDHHLCLEIDDMWVCKDESKVVMVMEDYKDTLPHFIKYFNGAAETKRDVINQGLLLIHKVHSLHISLYKINDSTMVMTHRKKIKLMELNDAKLLGEKDDIMHVSQFFMEDIVQYINFIIDSFAESSYTDPQMVSAIQSFLMDNIVHPYRKIKENIENKLVYIENIRDIVELENKIITSFLST